MAMSTRRRKVAVILVYALSVVLSGRAAVAQTNITGQWSGPYNLPLVAVHATFFPQESCLFTMIITKLGDLSLSLIL